MIWDLGLLRWKIGVMVSSQVIGKDGILELG